MPAPAAALADDPPGLPAPDHGPAGALLDSVGPRGDLGDSSPSHGHAVSEALLEFLDNAPTTLQDPARAVGNLAERLVDALLRTDGPICDMMGPDDCHIPGPTPMPRPPSTPRPP